ncbi:MAG: hypothetical protein P8J20_18400 [Novosphingobium sp.]|nr:hypothetical protein [Novosphingobium sp.]
MKSIKVIFAAVGLVVLLAVLLVGLGGVWLNRNLDTVAEAAVDASGIKDQMAKANDDWCRSARERFQSMWDKAVDSGTLESREAALERAEADVTARCAAN